MSFHRSGLSIKEVSQRYFSSCETSALLNPALPADPLCGDFFCLQINYYLIQNSQA